MVSSGTGRIAKRWRELHGEHSWKGLLEPLDMDLRKSIISYGELAAATSDGFNDEAHSLHTGLCRYGHDDLLTMSGVAAAGHYMVTKFVYAWEKNKPTWIGYVAAATDEGVAALGRRDVVVAWRGSSTATEWFKDILFLPTKPWPALGLTDSELESLDPSARVHSGFLSLYTETIDDTAVVDDDSTSAVDNTSARVQVLEEVRRLVELYRDEETSITVVGHSLGAALSVLNAVDLVGNGVNNNAPAASDRPPCPVTAVVFACPHVGNDAFRHAFASFKGLNVLHVKNRRDAVPFLMDWLHDLGVTLHIDTARSDYLKEPNLVTAHNLECYLHAVAGEVGSDGGGKLKLVVDRDVALVNKYADALKDEYHVPASWWVTQNKSMVKNDQGKWELKDFEHY